MEAESSLKLPLGTGGPCSRCPQLPPCRHGPCPTPIRGAGFLEEPAGNLHNILCKLISASDNDLGIAWSAEAAVTTLSNHILNYVSLYRKVLQKHTDMKSVCSSPTANHLTSFPVTAVTAALGSGKACPAGQTQTPQATRHPGPQAHPGRGTLPSLGTAPAQGESADREPHRGTYHPLSPGVPTALIVDKRGAPFPQSPAPASCWRPQCPGQTSTGYTILRTQTLGFGALSPFMSHRGPGRLCPHHPSPSIWALGSPTDSFTRAPTTHSPPAGELSLDSHTHAPGVAHPKAGGGGPVPATWGAWCRWPEGQKRPAPWGSRRGTGSRGTGSRRGRGPHPAQRGSPAGEASYSPAPLSLRLGARATTLPLFS